MELKEFYDKQLELDTLILEKKYCANLLTKEDHKTFINNKIIALYGEVGEFAKELESHWKYWKSNTRDDRKKTVLEYVDILFFWLSIGNTLGFKPDEVENAYRDKYNTNVERQRNDY